MKISIVIVNFNTKVLLVNCLKSIFEFTQNIDFEVIVVDNASTDDSQEAVKQEFKQVQFIKLDENLGFGMANNLGAASARGEFLFFLNSDTILIENSLKVLYDFFIEYESALKLGVLGCLLVDSELEVNGYGNHFPTVNREISRRLQKLSLIKNKIKKDLFEYDPNVEFFKIDYVIGADMLMKRDVFNKLSGFSKEFFMYYEESDLQKRLENFGLSCYITTKTKIIHLEDGSGKSLKRYSNKKRTIVHKSLLKYLKRNQKSWYFYYATFDFLLLTLTFVNTKYTVKENKEYFMAILKSY